jgi:hypothetical protein
MNTAAEMLHTFASGKGFQHSDGGKFPRPLNTASMANIITLMDVPQCCAKDAGQWIMPSNLQTRNKAAQLEAGEFWILWGDLDGTTTAPPATADAAGIVSGLLGGREVLAYSSASATEGKQKARLIVPLAAPVDGITYQRMARAFNDLLADHGLEPDRKTESANQIMYLPNRGEFYATSRAGSGALSADVLAPRVAEIAAEEAAQKAADDAARVRSAEKLQARLASGTELPIVAFNACYDVGEALRHYGYKKQGSRYLSPFSDSGSPAIVIKDGRWISNHGSDVALGIGRVKGQTCSGDAFDLFKFFECGNDQKAAIKAAGALTGVTQANRDNWHTRQANERAQAANQPHGFEVWSDKPQTPEQIKEGAELSETVTPLAESVSPAGGLLRLIDGADLAANAKAPTYLIDEVLEEDAHGIMGGLSMTYKSFMALRMAYSVCTGVEFMGRRVYRTGPVIYVCGEGAGGISRRWKAIQLKLGDIGSGKFFMYGAPLSLNNLESMQLLKECIEQVRPALVIFDTFASLSGGVEENSPTEVGQCLGNVRRVCQAGGASSLIVHHFGKDATKGFRGASNFTNDVDFAYMVNRPDGDQTSRKA